MESPYRSREDVIARDANGTFLLYPKGSPIPEAEAIRQGIIADPAATKRVSAAEVEDKAVKPATKTKTAKTSTSKE